MVTRSQKIRLGVFLALAFLALLATFFIILAPRFFENRDTYYIGFRDTSVTGLQEGGSVKYHGLTVGFISDIYIDPDDIRRVIVQVSLENGTPIKTDTKAEIAFLGITGLKVIELQGGTSDSSDLKIGGFIETGRSITDEITGKAEIIAEKAEVVLNNLAEMTAETNQEKIFSTVERLSIVMVQIHELLRENKNSISNTMANVEDFSYELMDLSSSAKNTVYSLEKLTQSDSVKQIFGNLADVTRKLQEAEIVQLFQDINVTLVHTNKMLQDIEAAFAKSRTDMVYTIESLRESAEYLNQFSRMISEDPSILVRGTQPKDVPDKKLE